MRQWSEHSTPINLAWVQVLLCTQYITLGVGRGILGGITSFLGEQNGGSVVTETQKRGWLKTSEGFRVGTTQICLENEDRGREIVKVIKSY